jgi:dipeptidyl aminopeptidase/acylaminoacyl peptidase
MEKASAEEAVIGLKTPMLLIHGLDDHNIPLFARI